MKKLIRTCVENSANSFELLLNNKVKPGEILFTTGSQNLSSKESYGVHVLKTTLKGDFTGKCFLILSQKEVDIIHNNMLPESMLNDTPKNRKLKGAMLIEMKNILVAAILTKIADRFNKGVYGEPSTIHVMHGDVTNQYLLSDLEPTIAHSIKTTYNVDNLNISPEFVFSLYNN